MIRKLYLTAWLALAILLVACTEAGRTATPTPGPTPSAPATPTPSVAEIVNTVSPAMVRILTPRSGGSGILVRSDGMILTASHLVEGIIGPGFLATVDVVNSAGQRMKGKVICQDPDMDLAIVYVEAANLDVVTLGDSARLRPGNRVIKMGYTLDLPGGPSVTTGIVSAIRRDQASGIALIQTDAPLSPGDSGGPILDEAGRVVGISSKKWVGPGIEGVGFALAIGEAKRTLLKDLDEGVNCVMPPLGFPIGAAPGNPEFPDISGSIVVWTDGRRDIYAYDLVTKRQFQASDPSAQGTKYIPSIDGNIIVWGDTRNGNGDIYAYDLRTGAEFPVTVAPGNQWSPQVSGNIVVWQDDRNGNLDIYGYDLNTQTEFQITTDKADQHAPRISGDIIIWEDRRHDHYTPSLCPGPRCDRDPDAIRVYGYELTSMTEFPLPLPVWVIDGELAVYAQGTPMGDEISVFNIRSQEQLASWVVPRDAIDLAISGNLIVWVDNREGTFDSLYGYDLHNHTEFLVARGRGISHPSIYGSFVAWSAYGDIYIIDVSNAPQQVRP